MCVQCACVCVCVFACACACACARACACHSVRPLGPLAAVCLSYPSGGVAVCQSGSGLPCGGFYTNVFSDGPSPAVIASVTAFGRGAATHPVR